MMLQEPTDISASVNNTAFDTGVERAIRLSMDESELPETTPLCACKSKAKIGLPPSVRKQSLRKSALRRWDSASGCPPN